MVDNRIYRWGTIINSVRSSHVAITIRVENKVICVANTGFPSTINSWAWSSVFIVIHCYTFTGAAILFWMAMVAPEGERKIRVAVDRGMILKLQNLGA